MRSVKKFCIFFRATLLAHIKYRSKITIIFKFNNTPVLALHLQACPLSQSVYIY